MTVKDYVEGGRNLHALHAIEIENPVAIYREAHAGKATNEPTSNQPGKLTIAQLLRGAIRDSDGRPFTPDDVHHSFAGQSAKTADTHALESAQQRLAAGDDADTVRQETGWFKGADGQWRFEIDDSNAQLKHDSRDAERYADIFDEAASHAVPLADMLGHPALFAAYPQLKSIKVVVDPSVGQGGRYNESTRTIAVNDPYSYRGGHDELKSVLLHEIQHGIQSVEGFAAGGTEAGQTDRSTHADSLQAIKDAIVLTGC